MTVAIRLRILGSVFLVIGPLCAGDEKEPIFDGKPVSEWARLVRTGLPNERRAAVAALIKAGPKNKEAVRALTVATVDTERGPREAATNAFKEYGTAVEPILADAIKKEDRQHAGYA